VNRTFAQILVLGFVAAAVCSTNSVWALSMGPGLFMVQNVHPGQSVDVRKKSGVTFTLKNDSDQDNTYNLVCRKPGTAGLADWEQGYDEIPDASWCKLEKEQVVVPAKSHVEVGLTIEVPDKPEYYNCKWILAVVLSGASGTGKVGVGLAIAARVQIETIANDDVKTSGGTPIAILPCVIDISGKPGDAFQQSVKLKNNTDRVLECKSERLVQVYTEEVKYPRYTSGGFEALVKETWLDWPKDGPAPITLKTGEVNDYKVSGTIPKTAKPGGKYEELVFITAPPAEPDKDKKGPAGRDTRTFFRIRYEVAAEGAEKKPEEIKKPDGK
jgi:hypothetical protein